MNRKRTVIAGFCLCVLVAGIACALGMRVQPGGALIQGWPIGEKRELPTPLVIFNDDDAPRTMTVAAMKPSALGAGPIRGYAELPDTSWMSFQPAEVAVPPNGRAAVRMFLSVPPDERYLNQHWSVNLAVRGRPAGRRQIGLAVYPRFEIETRARKTDAAPHGSFVITPGTVWFKLLRPGGDARTAVLRIWNNGAVERTCRIAIHGRPEKGKRPVVALSGGQSWIPDTGWIQPEKKSCVIPAGKFADVGIRCAVPPGARHKGGAWEAVFVAEAGEKITAFARIRLTSTAANAKKAGMGE